MANSAGICTSFKGEVLTATHNLNAHSLNLALYLATASISPSTTAYTATGEASSSGYSAGGTAVTNGTVSTSGTTAIWTPTASVSWSGVTISGFDCALLYNASASNKAIAAFTFSSQTISAGNFTLTMPSNTSSTALIRLS